jgi:ATP-dependent RNA helicase DeaD
VRQVAYVVSRNQKSAALGRVLEFESPKSAIVFCRTRIEVESLTETLDAYGYRVQALHGGMMQRQRDRVMHLFRDGKADLLVATDVAARGLDIEHLSHVINYDVPSAAEAYVHRIGRTGRIGREGVAITLAEPREHRLLKNIESFTKQKIEILTVPSVNDLHARRLELTCARLRERLVAGGLDDVRVVVESLAQEFDILDVAAAAVKMAHEASAANSGESKVDASPASNDDKSTWGCVVRMYVGAGREAGIGPRDLVGAITGEAGVRSDAVGAIDVADSYSIVEIPEAFADRIIAALKRTKLRGRKVEVRRETGTSGAPGAHAARRQTAASR